MIRFTGYGVVAEKLHISHLPQFFHAPCRKNHCIGSKNDCYLFIGLDILYHHAKFGGDRTSRAGCRYDNVVFVCFMYFLSHSEAGALFVRGWHSLNKYCVMVYGSILMLFAGFFSEGIALSESLEFTFPWPDGATFFAKLRTKIATSPKIGRKVLRTTLYR